MEDIGKGGRGEVRVCKLQLIELLGVDCKVNNI